MFLIQEILVSDQLFSEKFMCNLNACKGACCWEGDMGAPLNREELTILEDSYPALKPYLPPASIARIEAEGLYTYYPDMEATGTPLHPDGACVYLTYEPSGIAVCGIEKAHTDGKVDWKKPISCHLYPIRVAKNETTGFEALNYDEWDICAPACTAGRAMNLPVFRFAEGALVRAYGQDFYDELEAAYTAFSDAAQSDT